MLERKVTYSWLFGLGFLCRVFVLEKTWDQKNPNKVRVHVFVEVLTLYLCMFLSSFKYRALITYLYKEKKLHIIIKYKNLVSRYIGSGRQSQLFYFIFLKWINDMHQNDKENRSTSNKSQSSSCGTKIEKEKKRKNNESSPEPLRQPPGLLLTNVLCRLKSRGAIQPLSYN